MKTRILPKFGLFLASCAALVRAEDLRRFERVEPHMGTKFYVALYAKNEAEAEKAFRVAFDRIHALDEKLSDYAEDSELNKLSAGAPHAEGVPLSDDLWQVLATSQQISEPSEGAFDVTAGPLTKLWRRARRQHRLPTEAELAPAREATGHQYLKLDSQRHTAQLLRPRMRLDLGGIAKGFASHQAVEALKAIGVNRALVGGSGDICAGDPPPDAAAWRVGIAPLEADKPPSRYLQLSNQSVSTSGDFWQSIEIDGVRYSHIVDPRTGIGITRRSSVTTIAPQGEIADAAATTISVLGPERGLQFTEKLNVEAFVIVQDESGIHESMTKGFEKYLE